MKNVNHTNQAASFELVSQPAPRIICRGEWTVYKITGLIRVFKTTTWPSVAKIIIDGGAIIDLDTAGAWALQQLLARLNKRGIKANLENFNHEQEILLDQIAKDIQTIKPLPKRPQMPWLAQCGKNTIDGLLQAQSFLTFFGEVCVRSVTWLRHPDRILWKPLLHTIETTGLQAMPIIGLLSFLIGIVLAYQMGIQLKSYGANIFIVNLLGLSIFREFAPLMTAIIIAGRSGSAFTAQIGTMQINEEVDALRTMGIPPIEQLVLQKVFGLVLSLPLLTVWSSIAGIFGGMVLAKQMLDISYYDFLQQFGQVITLKQFMIGLMKTPFFAIIIASVGCFQGFLVAQGRADSVGLQTTKSVVQAIFLIICTDALFSIILSWYRL